MVRKKRPSKTQGKNIYVMQQDAKRRSKARIEPLTGVRKAVHKAGQKMRQKAKGQPGRKKLTPYHRNLGPMGELGWDLIIEVQMTDDIKQLGIREMSYKNVTRILEAEVYEPLREYLMGPGRGGHSGLINTQAPRDTGALREALEDGIEDGLNTLDDFEDRTGPFKVQIGTPNVPYAKPVNQMPTTWLRHPRASSTNIGRRGKRLRDPEARSGWYNLILLNGRNKARKLYDTFIRSMINIMNPIKSQYNLKNLSLKIFKARFK